MAKKTHLREEPLAIPKGGVDPSNVEVCEFELDAERHPVLQKPNLPHRRRPNLSDRASKVF